MKDRNQTVKYDITRKDSWILLGQIQLQKADRKMSRSSYYTDTCHTNMFPGKLDNIHAFFFFFPSFGTESLQQGTFCASSKLEKGQAAADCRRGYLESGNPVEACPPRSDDTSI